MIWRLLGRAEPDRLVDARLQLHWAAQVVASVGYTLVDEQQSYRHLSLSFDDGRLICQPTSTEPTLRVALDPATLELVVFDADGEELESVTVNNRTLKQGYGWLETTLGKLIDEPVSLTRPDHDLPAHPISSGARFALRPGKHFHEIGSWYHDAKLAIEKVTADKPNVSDVRCWPHHFDIASMIILDPDSDPEHGRSIGVGLSPGDAATDQPYFYVTPWPYPNAEKLTDLPSGGYWHTLGWVGAVLKADRIVSHRTSDEQYRSVEAFLLEAIAVCDRLLK